MTHPVIHRHRSLHGALAAGAVLLSLGGAGIAAADDYGDRDGRDGYYYHDGYDRRDDDRYDQHDKKRGKHDRYDRHRESYDGDRYYYDRPAYRSGGYYGYYDRGYYRVAPVVPAPFVVPRHLYHRDYGAYDPYYRGTVWYAPHHHPHRLYYFPVIVGGYTEYRPFAYCGGAFFPEQYGNPGPRGYFGFQFGY
jgi:hypothetical protein